MWNYSKMLQYPINIKNKNPRLAKYIISQYGGPDGEIEASLRYISQKFAMPDARTKAVLNDIGTEELSHLEMVGALVHQLTRDASIQDIENAGLGVAMGNSTRSYKRNSQYRSWNKQSRRCKRSKSCFKS